MLPFPLGVSEAIILRAILLPATALLVLAAFGPLVPAAGATAVAPPECVEYLYVADYHWYRVCAEPKDLSCPVYFEEQHGVTVYKECVVPALNGVDSAGACIPTSGGMDYPSWLCVDPKDPLCPVYTVTTSDWGTTKRCFGVIGP